MTRRSILDPVAAFTAALGVAGIGGALLTAELLPRPAQASWLLVPAMTVLLAVAAHLLVRFKYREQVMALDLFESVLAGSIVLYPAPATVLMAAVALVVVELLHHRTEIRKIAFNIAQWVSAAAAGAAVFAALGAGSPDDPATALRLIPSMAAVALVNVMAFASVMRLAQGEQIRHALRRLAPSITLGWGVNTLFGVLFIATFAWTPIATGVFLLVLLVLHGGYRGYAAALADRARATALHRATQALSTEVHPLEALPAFLEQVRVTFGAERAELIVGTDAGARVYRCTATGTTIVAAGLTRLQDLLIQGTGPVRIDRDGEGRLADALRSAGRSDCIAVPVEADGGRLGTLIAYDRTAAEGFETAEVSVLEALAREAATALVKGKLLTAIVDERRRFSEIVNTTSDGIFTIAGDGMILSWNPALESITGYLASELVGTRLLDTIQPRDDAGTPVQIHRALGTATELPAMVRIMTRQGDTKWLSCSYTRVAPTEDRPEALIVVARDRTGSYELDRLKEDFVATVSHELRTPLTPIKGWAATLMEAGDRLDLAHRTEAARSILRQAEGLERLIVNLLDVAKIQRGVDDRRETVVDVRNVVDKVVKDARLTHPERVIRLQAAGMCRAAGDDLWVERIVSNLVSNALKYAPANEPIDVSIAEAPGNVTVSVTDRGPGIPAADAERIFERFRRLGDHMTRETGGAGLGLYIARQLAHAIGAELSVESVEGHGATFTLALRGAAGLVAVV